MKRRILDVVNAFALFLEKETETQVIVLPSDVKSEKFHVELGILPHPVIVGNGRIRVRLRAVVFAEIPASEKAIEDCLQVSCRLAVFFENCKGFEFIKSCEKGGPQYAGIYSSTLKSDDDLFSEVNDDIGGGYAYTESRLVELEFNMSDFI